MDFHVRPRSEKPLLRTAETSCEHVIDIDVTFLGSYWQTC